MDTNYSILKLDKKIAGNLVEKYHYLHRKPQIKISYGLFKGNVLVGVITFAKPHSHTLLEGVAGKTYKNRILELNRLWIRDEEPRNTESWFISRCLKLIKCSYVVSFADPSVNHVGYIYQATNWIYTGKGNDSYVLVPKNVVGHHLSSIYGKTVADLIDIYGEENLEKRKVIGKHRYIFIPHKGRKKKELLAKLRYKVQPYPKL